MVVIYSSNLCSIILGNINKAKIIAKIEEKNKRKKLSQIILSLYIIAIEREKEKVLTQLKEIGANIIKVNYNIYEITINENIDIKTLFSLCEKVDLEYHIYIKDSNIKCTVVTEKKVEFEGKDYLQEAKEGDFCFVEDGMLPNQGIEKFYVFCW